MAHGLEKNTQTTSLIGRIFSMEAFLLFIGIALLVYGIANGATMVIFWACVIIPGVIILHQVRKRDWTKHWQEMEAEHKMREEFEARRRSAAEEARKSAEGNQ